jgi:hypothetical protein
MKCCTKFEQHTEDSPEALLELPNKLSISIKRNGFRNLLNQCQVTYRVSEVDRNKMYNLAKLNTTTQTSFLHVHLRGRPTTKSMAMLSHSHLGTSCWPLMLSLYSLTNPIRGHIICHINFHCFPSICLFMSWLHLCLSRMNGVRGTMCLPQNVILP